MTVAFKDFHWEQKTKPQAGQPAAGRLESLIVSGYWSRFVEIGLGSLLINLFGLLTPLFSMLIYDKVIGNNITATLLALTTGMVIIAGLDFILRLIRAFYIEQIALKSDVTVDEDVVARLLGGLNGKIYSSGELISKYRDLVSAREIISSSYMMAVADLPFLAIYILLLAVIGGPVALVVIALGGGLVLFNLVLKRPSSHYNHLSQRYDADRLALLSEIATHTDLIKSSPLRLSFIRRWQNLVRLSALARSKSRFWMAIGYSSINDGALLMWVGALAVGALLVDANQLTVGGLTACSLLAGRVGGLIGSFALLWSRYDLFKNARANFRDILPEGQETAVEPYLSPRALTGTLQLVDVSFTFPKKEQASLSKITFSIRPGEKIGILGRNGCGKSTLLRCMAGVLVPTHGQVIIDAANLLAFDPVWRAQWLAFKPQEPLLFEGSLEKNLIGDQVPVGAELLQEALYVSGLSEAIARGEFTLDTPLLSGGANLSGGQRQSVALARALMANPSLLLLDEPTAGVDSEMEAQVVSRLLSYVSGRKTLIVATHSLSLLKAMDRIIVLQNGAIVADGPRDQVIVS